MAKKKGNNYIIDETNGIAKIELHRRNEDNLYAIIDLEDLERVKNYPYTWFAQYRKELDDYYVRCTNYSNIKNGVSSVVFLHQFIMNADGKDVDHINNKTLDNRKSNLRVSEHKNNTTNRHGKTVIISLDIEMCHGVKGTMRGLFNYKLMVKIQY